MAVLNVMFKQLKKCSINVSYKRQVVTILFSYCTTPTSSGVSPNEIIFKVKPKTRLNLLRAVQLNNTFDFVSGGKES